MIKKALLVGIKHYYDIASNLDGCLRDVDSMAKLLESNYDHSKKSGQKNFHCKSLKSSPDGKSDRITQRVLKREIKALFEDPEVDVALFYFSGHGFENSLGGYLVTQDARTYEEGISFNEIIRYANNATGKEIIIILDCCNSGHFGKVVISKNHLSEIKSGISVLTASTSAQDSWDTSKGGVFTQLLCHALTGGDSDITGNINITHLYRHAERMLGPWEQRPTLKMNTDKLVTLRKVEPRINLDLLKKIKTYFPFPDYIFDLDPSYEPTEKTAQKEKTIIFSILQMFANNGLVKPIGEEHMYYAAIRSKSCGLTLLGKQYWNLIHKQALSY